MFWTPLQGQILRVLLQKNCIAAGLRLSMWNPTLKPVSFASSEGTLDIPNSYHYVWQCLVSPAFTCADF